MCHAQDGYGTCLADQGCLICFRNIQFPPAIYEIFVNLLIVDRPADRISAETVAAMIEPLLEGYETDFAMRADSILEAVVMAHQ